VLGRVLRNTFFTLCGLLLLTYLLIWALSPWIIKSQAKPMLEELSYQLDESSRLRFNPFNFSLSFDSLSLTDLSNRTTHASINEGHINLDSFALLRQALVFESVSLNNAKLEIEQTTDTLTIAGYVIDLSDQIESEVEAAASPENESPTQWSVEIIDLTINNFLTQLNHKGQHHALNLSQLALENVALSLNDQRGELSLNAQMNGATLAGQLNFGVHNQTGQARISLSLENFNPEQLVYLSGKVLNTASANINAHIDQTITLKPDSIMVDIAALSLKIDQLKASTPEFNISNETVELSANEAYFTIEENTLSTLDGKLNLDLSKLVASPLTQGDPQETPQTISLTSLSLKDIELNLDTDEQLQLSGQSKFALSLANLNSQQLMKLDGEAPEGVSADINAQIDQTITLGPDTIVVDIKALSLSVEQLLASMSGIKLSNDTINVTANDSHISIDQNKLSSLDGKLSIEFNDFVAAPASNDAKPYNTKILALNSLTLKDIVLSLDAQNQALLFIPQVAFEDIRASDPSSTLPNEHPMFITERFELNQVALGANSLSIENAILAPFKAAVHINADKKIANLILPHADAETVKEPPIESLAATTAEPNQSSETAQIFGIALGQFTIDGESELVINDESISPAFMESFTISNASLGAFDSSNKQLKSPYALNFKAGQYSQGSLSGAVALFSEKLNADIDAVIKEFSLPSVSPYVRGAAGMDMVSGQFDNVLSLKIEEDILKGSSKLKLRGLEVESATDVKKGNISEHAFIPLGLALGALKDSDGNIEMSIPLSGNVHDPDVGLNGFIYLVSQKAALSAAESYLINTFVPYANIVSLTKMAGEFALKVRIENLVYQPAQVELSPEQDDFIAGFTALLEQKPNLQIKVCPYASAKDLEVGSVDLEDIDTVAALKKIAKERGDHFKETLIKKYGVSSARLLICQAAVDGRDKALPRMEFNI
jgi:Domain of Unknown Function (DUF748)